MPWVGLRPAPVTPDLQSAMMPSLSISPASKAGTKARGTAVV